MNERIGPEIGSEARRRRDDGLGGKRETSSSHLDPANVELDSVESFQEGALALGLAVESHNQFMAILRFSLEQHLKISDK